MTALRRRRIVATLLKLGRKARSSKSISVGPGCTCESCVQAWDRHRPKAILPASEAHRLGFGN